MAKDWAITELKQKIEDDIPDENARKSILKLFANVIEKNYDINPSNWNVSYRTGGSGLRFQLNFGHTYILGLYKDCIIVMCEKESFFSLSQDFQNELFSQTEVIKKDGILKICGEKCIEVKIPFSKCEKYIETLEPAICDFAKWCTENRKLNPESEEAHVPAFIDYMNQELETNIPQPEYEGEWNPNIEEQLKLYKDFQTEFPIAKIRNLTLREYNNTERKNAFCYWIETRLRKLGSIQGSTSYKFGIYEYNENPRDDNGYSFDGQYAWLSKYGKSSDEAYEKVHSNIINIIEAAQHGDLDEIEKIDISPMFKWKIAFLYSDFTLMNIFSREGLVYLANKYGLEFADKATLCELYQFLLSKKGTEEHILKYSARIWNEWVKSKNKLQGDTQMAQEDTLVKKYANLLKNTKNLILTGAPGTGKTYLAKQIAKELGCEDDNIGFVQFHPSYDYTDFVEGLRPTDKDGNGNVGFERRDGVFKEFCEKALKNFVDSRKSVEEIEQETDIQTEVNSFLLNAIDKQITFKTLSERDFYISNIDNNRIEVKIPSNEKYNNVIIRYNELIELLNLKKEINQVSDIRAVFSRKVVIQSDSYLFILYRSILSAIVKIKSKQKSITKISKIKELLFVFIIDEINRGEVAKIFGELFYCVDPGYRGENGRISTQYQNLVTSGEFQKGFFIPENVYIIGTMNDIDRSVESMDFAFRRRFSWIEVKAKDTQYMLDAELDTVLAKEAKRRMENLNAEISKIEDLNDAYHIGASYFLKLKNYDGDFESLWEYHIKGILQEYLRGNPNAQEELEKLKVAYDREEKNKDGE